MRVRVLPAVLLLLGVCVALSSCATHRAPNGQAAIKHHRFEPATWAQVPGWSADNLLAAWPVFMASCHAGARPELAAACEAAESVVPSSAVQVRQYFENYFEPFKVLNAPTAKQEDAGLITAYYEPQLNGSRTPTERYATPLYAPPPDLLTVELSSVFPELQGKRVRGRLAGNKVVPYYTRAQLANDPALRGNELVWIDDPLDAFLLEIQGSGRVRLPDGQIIRLHYADQNGQPYRSIGRYLVEQGWLALDQTTLPGIRAWLAANPDRLQQVLDYNPSVVFFEEEPLQDPNMGPKGAQGVPLTAGRSIAVDPAVVPLGAPVFLATTLPVNNLPLRRLVVAQDTGGSISGGPRADLYWGVGAEAEQQAGLMRQQGSLWMLWPRLGSLPPD